MRKSYENSASSYAMTHIIEIPRRSVDDASDIIIKKCPLFQWRKPGRWWKIGNGPFFPRIFHYPLASQAMALEILGYLKDPSVPKEKKRIGMYFFYPCLFSQCRPWSKTMRIAAVATPATSATKTTVWTLRPATTTTTTRTTTRTASWRRWEAARWPSNTKRALGRRRRVDCRRPRRPSTAKVAARRTRTSSSAASRAASSSMTASLAQSSSR